MERRIFFTCRVYFLKRTTGESAREREPPFAYYYKIHMYIYIYSQRQTKRALRLTKHHLFIVVAFAAEAMMDDDAVRGKIFCTYSLRGMPSCKTKRVKKFKKSNPTFYPRKGPSSNHHSQRGVEYHHQLHAQKLCRACEDKNDSSLGVVFVQSRSF